MPREITRQEFDAIAARVAQSAPAGLSRQEFDNLVVAEAMMASGYEAPLTRERPAPGTPSALDAGHHPEVDRDLNMSPFSTALGESGETFGRASNDNLPAIATGGAALLSGGLSVPASAAIGGGAAVAREGLRRVVGEGEPMTGEQLGVDVLKEGALSGLAGAPQALMRGARVVGPSLAKNARSIGGAAARTLSGGGFAGAVASGNVPAMLTAGTAAIATDPRVIRGVGNIATRVGNSPIGNTIANGLGRFGFGGAMSVKALLEALGEDPASTVP